MKKFSTAACLLAFASALSFSAAAETHCTFKANAPDKHVVVRGDTLWDISGAFLDHPWCWPQVWGMNREEIHNPHWIYPGQIVYFDRAAGRLRLGSASDTLDSSGLPVVRLSPQTRMQGLGKDAIPAIPAGMIEPFLVQPLVVEEGQLDGTPRIMATEEKRVVLGQGDRAYVRGDLKGGTSFQVFRPGKPLKDPETGKLLGYEAEYLGTVKLDRKAAQPDEASSFTVVNAKEEMGVGDRLLPVPPTPILNYVPHPPEKQVAAHVASIYGGVAQAGQNQVVAINRGAQDGLDIGTVLQLYHAGRIVNDRTDGGKRVMLPDEQYGSLFVFRVFNHVAYGLVMEVTDPVQVGDAAKSPE